MQVKDSAFLWRPLFLSVEAPASRLGDTQSPVPNPQGQEAVPRREGSAGEQGADEMEIGRDTPTPTPLTNHPHPKETTLNLSRALTYPASDQTRADDVAALSNSIQKHQHGLYSYFRRNTYQSVFRRNTPPRDAAARPSVGRSQCSL
uniref:Uncharacterized protein n=1 Tax=Knipowitschia caucasica TaxID=637954 RepID=A0AAV2MGA1_KNICA